MLNAAIAILAASLSIESLAPVNATVKSVEHRGRSAVQLVPGGGEDVLAIVKGSSFTNGTIEVDLAGAPRAGAPADSRGFIGVAFHVEGSGERYECIYVRPTNARADDQLRRNHTLQYVAHPDHPWHALRKSHPGLYESYADMEAGAWTKLKIVVRGRTAKLYVNGAAQPALIVNDLKHGETGGAVALWGHTTTDAYFANLRVRAED
jgi:hypothetical protein